MTGAEGVSNGNTGGVRRGREEGLWHNEKPIYFSNKDKCVPR